MFAMVTSETFIYDDSKKLPAAKSCILSIGSLMNWSEIKVYTRREEFQGA